MRSILCLKRESDIRRILLFRSTKTIVAGEASLQTHAEKERKGGGQCGLRKKEKHATSQVWGGFCGQVPSSRIRSTKGQREPRTSSYWKKKGGESYRWNDSAKRKTKTSAHREGSRNHSHDIQIQRGPRYSKGKRGEKTRSIKGGREKESTSTKGVSPGDG